MEGKMYSKWPLAAALLLTMSSGLSARNNDRDACAPTPGAPCYTTDEPECPYCLGPELVNPSVRPKTCNGDITVTVAGFYWNAHQDGMEYAIDDHVTVPTVADNPNATFLIDSNYKTPNFNWEFGFKLGLGYNMSHDGWDIGVEWTWYKGTASSHIETEADDNHTLLPLWSAYQPPVVPTNTATDIRTDWTLKLNLIDISLGREFWVSKYLTLRPFVGVRVAYLYQDFDIQHSGGSWSAVDQYVSYNGFVDLDNNFRGAGLRSGLDTVWHLGRGWSIFGNGALSLVYGKFTVKHDEYNRQANNPTVKVPVLETEESFRVARLMADLALGVQWATLFCDCKYGFSIGLAWENHLFFHQNQMWRVQRVGGTDSNGAALPNNTGENVFYQRRGTLDTQGWTLTVKFDF